MRCHGGVQALYGKGAHTKARHAGTRPIVISHLPNKEHVPLEQGNDGKVPSTSSSPFVHHSHLPIIVFAASSPKRASGVPIGLQVRVHASGHWSTALGEQRSRSTPTSMLSPAHTQLAQLSGGRRRGI